LERKNHDRGSTIREKKRSERKFFPSGEKEQEVKIREKEVISWDINSSGRKPLLKKR